MMNDDLGITRGPDAKAKAFRVGARRTEHGIALHIVDGAQGAELKIELRVDKMLLVYRVLGQAIAEARQ